jgi:rhomboid protease GluP
MDSRRMCPHCRAFITNRDKVCPYCHETVGARQVDRRSDAPIMGFIPHARFNTFILLTVNLGMYLLTVLYSMRAGNSEAVMNLDQRTLADFGAKFGPYIQQGQWWRLVTAGFLHAGIFHIGMNMWVLYDVGAQVEEFYGATRMYVIYFAATIFGFYLSYLCYPMVLSMGASAGIMGLIGAMIALGVTHRSPMGSAIRSMYVRWLIWILIIGLLPGFNTDNAAHIGGAAAGFGVAYLAGLPRLEGSPVERLWRVAAWLCILITVVCFLNMYLWLARTAQ